MAHPIEIEDTYGPDGVPEEIVMFNKGLYEVSNIASRNVRRGIGEREEIVFDDSDEGIALAEEMGLHPVQFDLPKEE